MHYMYIFTIFQSTVYLIGVFQYTQINKPRIGEAFINQQACNVFVKRRQQIYNAMPKHPLENCRWNNITYYFMLDIVLYGIDIILYKKNSFN